uniref:Uncharacterized protein n=1 Tax=Rangifer tarandus platyrhynchus TaxID=3082113 RepID=A0ACB0E639_RANTA|nr:unnamed protein product [Rangifer tarandus platyrhynchus]
MVMSPACWGPQDIRFDLSPALNSLETGQKMRGNRPQTLDSGQLGTEGPDRGDSHASDSQGPQPPSGARIRHPHLSCPGVLTRLSPSHRGCHTRTSSVLSGVLTRPFLVSLGLSPPGSRHRPRPFTKRDVTREGPLQTLLVRQEDRKPSADDPRAVLSARHTRVGTGLPGGVTLKAAIAVPGQSLLRAGHPHTNLPEPPPASGWSHVQFSVDPLLTGRHLAQLARGFCSFPVHFRFSRRPCRLSPVRFQGQCLLRLAAPVPQSEAGVCGEDAPWGPVGPSPRCPGSSCVRVEAMCPVTTCTAPAKRDAGSDHSPGSAASVGRCAAGHRRVRAGRKHGGTQGSPFRKERSPKRCVCREILRRG